MLIKQSNKVKISALVFGTALTMATLSGCISGPDINGTDINGSASKTPSASSTPGNSNASDSSKYCDAIAATIDDHLTVGESELVDPEAAFGALRALSKQSPDELKADWEVLDSGIQDVLTGLENAGITFDDLHSAFAGDLPDGVSLEDLDSLEPAFEAMASSEYLAAQLNVQNHAKTECDLELDFGNDF